MKTGFTMRTYGQILADHFDCALSNLFRNEQDAEILCTFLKKYKKYGSKREQKSIQDFLDGIDFYKEQKIFFGEEEE